VTGAQTDHRSVPLEVLREFVRSHAEMTSIRAVAEDAHVSRSTVHKFIASESMPQARVRRLLAMWYLRRVEGGDDPELTRPYTAAIGTILADLPAAAHAGVMADLLDSVSRRCAEAGGSPPPWVDHLRRRWFP
jgi:hypothetical protein